MAGTWGHGSSAGAAVRQAEQPLEQAVSQYICQMPFLWLAVDDEPGPASLRGMIERNAIALLSNFKSQESLLDPPSPTWLGRQADRESIHRSGLWNVNHVAETYDPVFLELFNRLVNLLHR